MFSRRSKNFTYKERRSISVAIERRSEELESAEQPLSTQLLDYAKELFRDNKYGNCISCQLTLDIKLLLVKPEIMYCDKCYFQFEDMIERENIRELIELSNIPALKGKLTGLKRLMLNALLANRVSLARFITRKTFRNIHPELNQEVHKKIISAIESNFQSNEFLGLSCDDFYEIELELDFKTVVRLLPYLDETRGKWVEVEYDLIIEEGERNQEIDYLRLLNSLNLKTSALRFTSNEDYTVVKAGGALCLSLEEIGDRSLELLFHTLRYQNSLLKTTLEVLNGEAEPVYPETHSAFRSKGWTMMDINYAFNRYLSDLPDDLRPLVYFFNDASEFRIIFPLFNDKNTSKGELAFSFDKNELLEDGIRGFVELPLELKNDEALRLVNSLNNRTANPSNSAPWISGNWINVEQEGRNIILYSVFLPNRFKKYSAFEEHIGNIVSEVVKSWEYYKVEQEFLRATEGEVIGGE